MGKKATRRVKRRRRGGILSAILILLLLAALGVRLQGLRVQVANARMERDRYQEQVEELSQKNEALEADISQGATDEKIAEIARRELGMVMPDEYVFYNSGS